MIRDETTNGRDEERNFRIIRRELEAPNSRYAPSSEYRNAVQWLDSWWFEDIGVQSPVHQCETRWHLDYLSAAKLTENESLLLLRYLNSKRKDGETFYEYVTLKVALSASTDSSW